MDLSSEIDDSLYSRQRYVLGDDAMHKLGRASVMVVGLGGLGLEIAKNIILGGPKLVALCDWNLMSADDLGTHYYAKQCDLGKNRAEVSAVTLKDLNPYVCIQLIANSPNDSLWWQKLLDFDCIIMTGANRSLNSNVDTFCRRQTPTIKFIGCDVRGVLGWLFCDFGPSVQIVDADGEEVKECFIQSISKGQEGVVTTWDDRRHGFSDGDSVRFDEVIGMEQLNATVRTIKVINTTQFSIGDTSGYCDYVRGGICTQIKVPKMATHQSFDQQWTTPKILDCDFCHMERKWLNHSVMQTLLEQGEQGAELVELVRQRCDAQLFEDDTKYVQLLCDRADVCFAPLCSVLGSMVAQEAMKAVTCKFTPLDQWMYVDAVDVCSEQLSRPSCPRYSRYWSLEKCIGSEAMAGLSALKIFMVGCGAIGCELLKNFALLGCSRAGTGQLAITDHDLIEKSNLNRQFLFRPQHIQQSKSVVSAASTKDINPELNIVPYELNVCKETEANPFNDQFFTRMDVVVNALDSVEARLYVDSRCVTNVRPLLESGTMGVKGHVQVIVPHLTESYSSQSDPPETRVPFCTLKSFPTKPEHAVQWARYKFENLFSVSPLLFNKFWTSYPDLQVFLELLKSGQMPENAPKALKLLTKRPKSWVDCVRRARLMFEKYFRHKAMQLLLLFPEDYRTPDGSLFWQSPNRRAPGVQGFDVQNQTHFTFVLSAAKLLAATYGVETRIQDYDHASVIDLLSNVVLPPFVPKNKRISVDDSSPEEQIQTVDSSSLALQLSDWLANKDSATISQYLSPLEPQNFEKDNNLHLDFVSSTSSLRAFMYGMDYIDRFKAKKIAGNIIPAIATTTACVAGLVAIELVKLVKNNQQSIETQRNAFINLALPSVVFSEPGAPTKQRVAGDLYVSVWDRVELTGNDRFLLQDFLDYFGKEYSLEVSMVSVGNKLVYLSFMPNHAKRLRQRMIDLCPPLNQSKYVDLSVSLDDQKQDESDVAEDTAVLSVRYFYGQ